ncbi:MAG: sigma-70 family RNA polymerase sigma factor [Eubacteriaceae bacterium]
MNHNEITALVRGAKEKREDCQLQLIEGFRPLILAMIKRYVYDYHSHEDYLNQGALILLKSVNSFQEDFGVPFPGYLKKELFYYFVNFAKKNKNLESLDAPLCDGESTLLDAIKDANANTEENYLHFEEMNALFRYLPRLRERQQWIIEEHYFKGRKIKDISQSIGVSANSLVKLHRRAISDLRNYFGLNLPN